MPPCPSTTCRRSSPPASTTWPSRRPLDHVPRLSQRLDNRVLLKREDLQPVFSFKLRGAYNKMAQLCRRRAARGRHLRLGRQSRPGRGAGGAAAGRARRRSSCRSPRRSIKIDGGAKRAAPRSSCTAIRYDEAYAHARRSQPSRALTFIHPYDDPDVIAGQGTIGHGNPAPAPGRRSRPSSSPWAAAAWSAGIAVYVKWLRPEIKIIGVEPEDADAHDAGRSRPGERVTPRRTWACLPTAWRCSRSARRPSASARELVDDMILVDTDEICAAIKDVFEDTRSDPGAGRRAGHRGRQGVVSRAQRRTGPDAGRHRLRRQHELRPAALRRRAGGTGRAARGDPGGHDPRASGQLPRSSARCSARASITEFNYRYADPSERPHLRRRRGRQCAAKTAELLQRVSAAQGIDGRRPDRQRDGEAARPPHGGRPCAAARRTRSSTASSFRSGPAR